MSELNLPSETVMREMAKLAMEQATQFFAEMADKLAPAYQGLDGADAIKAFGNAIRATNKSLYPKGPRS